MSQKQTAAVRRDDSKVTDSTQKKLPARGAAHVVFLHLFTALFALRVAAQLVQYASPIAFLPPFEAWQGSRLDYPGLLASQLLIFVGMVWATAAVSRRATRRPQLGLWLVGLGAVYFFSMCVRLVLGLTTLTHVAWFARPLPALFHIVLASYVLTLGHYHRLPADRA